MGKGLLLRKGKGNSGKCQGFCVAGSQGAGGRLKLPIQKELSNAIS